MHNITSPASSDGHIEQLIQAKGKTAPRVTPADIEANILSEHYFTASDGQQGADTRQMLAECPGKVVTCSEAYSGTPLDLLTFCVLVLKNGYTVHGHSACASRENFDPMIGRVVARQNAVQQIWPLMGYALKEKLSG